jgi:amino acid adenylation domain-containing protein
MSEPNANSSSGPANGAIDGLMEVGAVAIVGMAGRFPGAESVEKLWEMVRAGRNAFSLHPADEIEDAFTDEERNQPNYVPARPHLENVDMFDAEFFGMFAREAALTDPQHRIFLEICWEALENGGFDPKRFDGLIGVYAGASMPTYLINNVLSERELAEEFASNYQIGCFQQFVGALNEALAMRVAYKFDLRGPAFTVQSACSTSLLAVAQACQQLQTYSCDLALAGGVSITVPQKRGYFYQEGGMASADGTCRPFDAQASGTVFASGAGVVLLKRFDDAVRDGDMILAVVRGSGVNNDGSGKVGFTAPSVDGQAAAIMTAHANAGIDPATVGYVECHGTATPLGDPIEFAGLAKAFGAADARKDKCLLGSLKGNVGHMDAAAGVSGLIKTVMAMRHKTIPAMANYTMSNPRFDLLTSPFAIPAAPLEWPEGSTPRRAGVSSFGVGGTNVHLVIEEAPVLPRAETANEKQLDCHILPLSARSPEALKQMRERLAAHLVGTPASNLADVAHTLQAGRRDFSCRSSITARSHDEAVEKLLGERMATATAPDAAPRIVFMFPGQGAQYVGMAAALYETEPVFAEWIDRGAEQLKPALNIDLRDFLCHAGPVSDAMSDELRETRIAQPCLYIVEHALARLWMSRGLKPDAMIGHSVGEFVAATLANTMSFDEGLRVVAARGALMQSQPQGSMVSVRCDADTAARHLADGIEIAAFNAPKLCVISGPFAAMDITCATLEQAGIAFSRLHTSHAFHSAMMDEACAALREETALVTYGEATIPYISCITGEWQTNDQGASSDYWARHCREAVQFAKGLQSLCADSVPVLLEVGPGRTLSAFAQQTISRDGLAAVVQSLPEHDRAALANEVFAEAHGRLWMSGCKLDWPRSPGHPPHRIALPTYPFQRQRHWINAPQPVRRKAAALQNTPSPEFANEPQSAAMQMSFSSAVEEIPAMNAVTPTVASGGRAPRLETELLALLTDMSGEDIGDDGRTATFMELGFDSLFIGQFAQRIEKLHKVKLSFRELLGNIPTVADLARHLDREMPAEPEVAAAVTAIAPKANAQSVQTQSVTSAVQPVGVLSAAPAAMIPLPTSQQSHVSGDVASLMQQQLQVAQALFGAQLQVLQGLGQGPAQTQAATPPPIVVAAAPVSILPTLPEAAARAPDPDTGTEYGTERIKLYKPGAKAASPELSPGKRAYIAELTKAYAARSPKSKAFAQANRKHLADPRTASGFRADWKELVFPVVSDRSKGARVWDIDGNEYIDLVNGFGQTAFGHAPDFVVDAVKHQMEEGFAIGPQTPLAGEVAAMIAETVRLERVTFCNTGSEAVMAAMRLARAVTGNDRIVVFANDYHGQFDEVLVKGRSKAGNPVALPIAPGIPSGSVSNMTVLKYGEPESLDWIRANAVDLAAVIVEPIQSRHPELQPREFVREIRTLATTHGFALVFDEVVTGFRVDPGGMQAIWNIKADMATYGKVVGGGMPIGVLAGNARFMDALDGGMWSFGDESVPMTAPTFFAGTFVRHPLVLAACRAVLSHIKGEGAALYSRVAERTKRLVAEIANDLDGLGIHNAVRGFKSWFAADFSGADSLGSLMFPELRRRGINIHEGYPCFLTTAHSEADFQAIAQAFRDSANALQAAGIMLGERRDVTEKTASIPAPALMRPATAPLTEAQTEIWLSAQAGDEASCAFNECFTLTLEGALDVAALRSALDDVIARHDAFHIRFARDGSHFAFIDGFRLELPLADLSGEHDPDAAFAAILADEASTPFDLVGGPLVRATLVRVADNLHQFVCTAHHIVCDGWSINILVEELAALYLAHQRGQPAALNPALSFATYATGLAPDASVNPAAEAHWLKEFATVPDMPDYPADRPHPEYKTYAGGTRTGHIDADTYKRLKKAGGKAGATLFSTLLGAMQVMLSRLSGAEDIVIAIPSAGQSLLADAGVLAGHCVNLLPLRQRVHNDEQFETHLKATQETVLKAFENQAYTYGSLVRKLGIKRNPQRLPLTEFQFNLERTGSGADFGAIRSSVVPNPKAFSNFDMFFNVTESPDGLRIDVDYNGDVYDGETVDRWIDHFKTLLGAIAGDTGIVIGELPLLGSAQFGWLHDVLNDTYLDLGAVEPVHALFAERAASNPDAVAAIHGSQSMTYGELDARANRLARHLQAAVSGSGKRIALLADRSLDMLVSLLAIMKAGHTYVPLDCAHPEARLRQTLEAAQVAAIVCDNERMEALAGAGVAKAIATRAATALTAIDSASAPPAYIIFTSGSTGTPKGVEISHAALSNFMHSMIRAPGFGADDTIIAVTTISFDIAALELYLPLIAGGKVVIADRAQVQDGFALVDLVRAHRPTTLQATPTLWRMLVEAGLEARPELKILTGGESLPADLAARLVALGGEVWNMYGPTETTIWSSVARIEDEGGPITIGRPIANTALHIVDSANRVAPVGVTGELLIGGAGLASGYFGRTDLTEKAFVSLDIGSGHIERLYRTGDVGKRLADGSLLLLGRRDNQVKLRGFRIELGDIEAVIGKLEGVRQCAAIVAENGSGETQLVAYVVPRDRDRSPSDSDLTTCANASLPAYMVPSLWVLVDDLPQTGNGKLDRKALVERGVPQPGATISLTLKAPSTPLEERLLQIWKDVLGLDSLGVDQNIFALGADSLSVFRIASRMLNAGLDLEAKDIMRNQTISALAAFAEQRRKSGEPIGSARPPSLRDFKGGARRMTASATL